MSTTETVRAWSVTAATNSGTDAAISSADTQAPDSIDNNIRSIMAATRKQHDDIGGKLTAGGSANALTVTTGQVLEVGQLVAGLTIVIKAASTNTSATVTFAPDGLTAAGIKRADGTALAIGSIQAGMFLDLAFNVGTTEWWAKNIAVAAAASISTGFGFGCTLSNDSGGTTAIAVAAGSWRDSTDVDYLVVASAITVKTLSVAWAVGSSQGMLDTGAVANNTYHIYLIKRIDTNIVDVIASLSASAPTLPANYTLFRRIGSIVRTAGAIVLFQQDGDRFRLKSAPSQDVNSANPGTSAVTMTLAIPTGIVVWADIVFSLQNGTSTPQYALVTSLDETDSPAGVSNYNVSAGVLNAYGTVAMLVKTNTSAQARYRLSISGASDTAREHTFGWVDQRGRQY